MDSPYNTIKKTYRDYTIKVDCHWDPFNVLPWEEHAGHGIVSDWETRDKRPGERVLASDHGSKRYYDFEATLAVAKRDGWGLSAEATSALAHRLGRPPTKREILVAAVEHDFEYLRRWCNDEWHWVGYVCTITDPEGNEVEQGHDSCWGFDDEDYMVEEAMAGATRTIDKHIHDKIVEQAEATAWAFRGMMTYA